MSLLLGLKANTHMFNRSRKHTVGDASKRTGAVQLQVAQVSVDTQAADFVLLGKHALCRLHYSKLDRYTGANTNQWKRRTLRKQNPDLQTL